MYYEDIILFLKILFKDFFSHILQYTQKTSATATLQLSEANSYHTDNILSSWTLPSDSDLPWLWHASFFPFNFPYYQCPTSISCLVVNLTPFRHEADPGGRKRTCYFLVPLQLLRRESFWCLVSFWSSGTLNTLIYSHAVWLK